MKEPGYMTHYSRKGLISSGSRGAPAPPRPKNTMEPPLAPSSFWRRKDEEEGEEEERKEEISPL